MITLGALGLASSTVGKDCFFRCSTHWSHKGEPAVDIKSVRIAVDHLLFSEKVLGGELATRVVSDLYLFSTSIGYTYQIRES